MAHEYLVTHGRDARLGRFSAPAGLELARGDTVVVNGRRGSELGEVLGPSRPQRATLPDDFIGSLIRRATPQDHVIAEQAAQRAERLCATAQAIVDELCLPFTPLDADVQLDGRGAVLHGVSHEWCDVGPLLDRLGEAEGLIVRLYDLAGDLPPPGPADDAEETFRCDKPDCGEGNCTNCGTDGGCSSCSAGGAAELTAHFAALREQMEAKSRVRLA